MVKGGKLPGMEVDVPTELTEAVDQYVGKLKARQRTQQKENELRQKVIELMKRHNVPAVEIDDERKLVLESKGDRVKIKPISDASGSGSDDDEDDGEE